MSNISNTNTLLLATIPLVFGVFIHDSKIYSATAVKNSTKESSIVAKADDHRATEYLHSMHHVHSENTTVLTHFVSSGSQTPSAQPKNEGDKKYLSKKILGKNNDSEYFVPIT